MKTNTIVELYKGCVLTEEKNFIVDNLLTALSSNYSNIRSSDSDGRLAFSNVQYQKIKLNMNLKLVGNETMLTQFGNYFYPSNNYNYALMIQTLYDDNDNIVKVGYYYFFVKKCKWLSQNCVELDIKLDTLNTYGYQLNNEVSAKSHTLRRHKDRFEFVGIDTQDNTKYVLYPKVDFYSEGINALKYHAENDDLKIQNEDVNLRRDFFLVYRNNEDLDSTSDLSKAVEAFVCTRTQTSISAHFGAWTGNLYYMMYMNKQPEEPSAYWHHAIYFTYTENGNCTFDIKDDNNATILSTTLDNGTYLSSDTTPHTLMIYADTDAHYYARVLNKYGNDVIPPVDVNNAVEITSTQSNAYRYFVKRRSEGNLPINIDDIESETTLYRAISGGNAPFSLTALSDAFELTDSRLIKVIMLPYTPVSFNGFGAFEADFIKGTLKLRNTQEMFNVAIRSQQINKSYHPYGALLERKLAISDIDANNTPRNINNETKLLHSDYDVVNFVYDSFSYPFRKECTYPYEVQQLDMTHFSFEFTTTSTINSRFLFTFNIVSKEERLFTEDYYNILPIARNNEIAIFNQQYINYLRAGYNYDVKAKMRTEAVSFSTMGLSIVGGATAGMIAGSSGGPIGQAVGAIVGAITGAVSSAIATANTVAQAEESFARKQEELKLQSASVYGSDDVDLMKKYSDNRGKLVHYVVSPKMKNILFNLFYYFGYVSDEYGNPFANGWTTSRKNFNFLQCELVFRTQWADSEIIEDLTNKFKDGATIFHKTTSGSDTNFYDFDQALENWETTIHS